MGRAVKESKAATKTAREKVGAAGGKAGRKSRAKAAPVDKEAEAPVKEKVTEKRKRPVPDIQKHADIETRRAFREICQGLLAHAREGAVSQTKLLIHIGKLGEKPSGRKRTGKSLTAILMEELQRTKAEENPVETAEKQAASDGIQERPECGAVQTAEHADGE